LIGVLSKDASRLAELGQKAAGIFDMEYMFPKYRAGELMADGVVHVLGVSASILGALVLLALSVRIQSPLTFVSLSIYCVGLVAVFCCSAAYNLVNQPRLKATLRRFDHACIYLKIAATYTPFAVVKMAGWPAWILMVVVWAIGIFGVTNKLLFPANLVKTSYVLYLAQGWAGLLVVRPLADALTMSTLVLLGIGGALYTIGVLFHLWEKLRYHNAIWHTCVLTASACHYAAILAGVALN
jgi:hemolysin III